MIDNVLLKVLAAREGIIEGDAKNTLDDEFLKQQERCRELLG